MAAKAILLLLPMLPPLLGSPGPDGYAGGFARRSPPVPMMAAGDPEEGCVTYPSLCPKPLESGTFNEQTVTIRPNRIDAMRLGNLSRGRKVDLCIPAQTLQLSPDILLGGELFFWLFPWPASKEPNYGRFTRTSEQCSVAGKPGVVLSSVTVGEGNHAIVYTAKISNGAVGFFDSAVSLSGINDVTLTFGFRSLSRPMVPP